MGKTIALPRPCEMVLLNWMKTLTRTLKNTALKKTSTRKETLTVKMTTRMPMKTRMKSMDQSHCCPL